MLFDEYNLIETLKRSLEKFKRKKMEFEKKKNKIS